MVVGPHHGAADFRPPPAAPPRTPRPMTSSIDTPRQSPALVLQRWNSWVRVYLPETGEVRWVDLSSTPHEPLESAEGAPGLTGRS
jgi:hypothetical protein